MKKIIILILIAYFMASTGGEAVENVVIATHDILPPLTLKNDQGQ